MMTGLLLFLQHTPPPYDVAAFTAITQSVMVGSLTSQRIAPPSDALPFVIVIPSKTATPVSPLWKWNPRPALSQSIVHVAGPSALRTVMSLPPKSRSLFPEPVYVPDATSTVSK